MFTVNQPEDAEMHEGLPLVALTDWYEDLRDLLHMLYDPVGYGHVQTLELNTGTKHMLDL